VSATVDRLVEVVGALREHCAWTAALTHEALVEYLVEESYELVESIEEGHPDDEVKGELADVLLQVVLHSAIAAERRAFDLDDVAAFLTAKMVRRNTHVFRPDGTLRDSFPDSVEEIIRSWDAAKRAERPERANPFEGLPKHLPALTLADKAIGRAERWAALEGGRPEAEDDGGAPDRGELHDGGAPPSQDIAADAGPASEAELGDLLLEIVRRARTGGLDAERALRNAVVRFAATHR
jgi:uncharacterized protein YabN with tetrapyrrole methylase and pyrophosphatase domain